ncbi:hypothetical protein [Streptomyces sp. NBC_01435]|uniref:hypothetical protein n=1 Tax=Streptomyces sp. NBC_01435 TaxID=2903865 RepID=UPI002E3263E9|nr:hypothetical protein [Streptomyces sp. NBC_01435]
MTPFAGVPKGFDAVQVKHFLDTFDKADMSRILKGVNRSLEAGCQVRSVRIGVRLWPGGTRDYAA